MKNAPPETLASKFTARTISADLARIIAANFDGVTVTTRGRDEVECRFKDGVTVSCSLLPPFARGADDAMVMITPSERCSDEKWFALDTTVRGAKGLVSFMKRGVARIRREAPAR
jgi:hypothetical protein